MAQSGCLFKNVIASMKIVIKVLKTIIFLYQGSKSRKTNAVVMPCTSTLNNPNDNATVSETLADVTSFLNFLFFVFDPIILESTSNESISTSDLSSSDSTTSERGKVEVSTQLGKCIAIAI